MIALLLQVYAALRSRAVAFGVLIGEVVFGIVVVSHCIVITELFTRQDILLGADMDGAYVVSSEDDDTSLAERDLAALRALPGVRAAAWVSNTPMRQRRLGEVVHAGDRSAPALEVNGTSEAAAAYGFELASGRVLTPADQAAAGPRPALVTAVLARALFGAEDPIGRTFASQDTGVSWRVAGVLRQAALVPSLSPVAGNVLVQLARPALARRAEFLANVEPAARAGFPGAAEAALRRIAPGRWLRIETLHQGLDRIFVARTGSRVTFGIIIALVLGIVLIGSTGMSAFLVAERLREIGIRRALGATRRDIALYFLVENFVMTSIGLVAGGALAMVLNRMLVPKALPFLVLDFRHLFLGMILFWVTGLLAASMPALRASRVPPSVASKTV